MGYKISDISKKTGLSTYTLRFYDQKGLLPFVARDKNGRRHFKEEDLAFLSIITCLKNTGMQLSDIKKFVEWSMDSDPTYEKRLDFFTEHKKEVERQLAQTQAYLDKIDRKIDKYTQQHETAVKKTFE
ncbi:MAG: MerR family transcriptional regulator [Enterococcus sp.]|uniref:MerR family transcriptional regulator n=1 Tax=Enterococcus raffinosus TaxID=71452 RepID=UPI001C11C8F5|nr:MerR family transcriptional regulator [Enterococcus raffinosus]MBU5363571.1 MerR family transcriptional regulator [Enterococcus raffinosus]